MVKVIHEFMEVKLVKDGEKFFLQDKRTGKRQFLEPGEARRWVQNHNFRVTSGEIEIVNTNTK